MYILTSARTYVFKYIYTYRYEYIDTNTYTLSHIYTLSHTQDNEHHGTYHGGDNREAKKYSSNKKKITCWIRSYFVSLDNNVS